MATDSSTGPSTRAPEPSHDELFADMLEVRSRGVGNEEKPLDDLAALRWAAKNGCPASHDGDLIDEAEKIEYVLGLAVSRLGGKSAQAIQARLGLSSQTRGRSPGLRCREAIKIFERSEDAFRTRFEIPLLMAVATYLRVLVDERCLAIREAELLTRLKHNENSPKPAVRGIDDDWENEPAFPWEPLISPDEIAKIMDKQQKETFLQLF